MARKTATSRLAARDSLSNLAASLGAGRDKAAHDAFFVADLARDQIEAMYRGDWLARKIVDIVPYDSIREWREWAGDRKDVAAIEAAERRLNLRRALQRAMILGRLYGGGALLIGTDEPDPAALATPLYPETMRPGSLRFLHVVSRWQLAVTAINHDPLDPYYGEPDRYRLTSPERGELALHPSRVIRFLGNPLPDPLLYGAQLWSDSLLQTLYDAIHGVALTTTGATSLIHEAKVDIVTVPNLSEHLSNAATTAQLSARFAYAAAMKSINNLLLLGDGETWARQKVDFAGLPEMVRTFLQIAAAAADIPVTRLLGQSPAGLSATGDSDTRNYYDMISARQELDLRPQLERIDALLLRSAGVDPAGVSFEFRPLWQLDAAEKASVALSKAQTTQIYAGLGLWPAATTAALVQGQLAEDGTYPNAEGVFAAGGQPTLDYDPNQPRDPDGRWTNGGESLGSGTSAGLEQHTGVLSQPSEATHASWLNTLLRAINPVGAAQAAETGFGKLGAIARTSQGSAMLHQVGGPIDPGYFDPTPQQEEEHLRKIQQAEEQVPDPFGAAMPSLPEIGRHRISSFFAGWGFSSRPGSSAIVSSGRFSAEPVQPVDPQDLASREARSAELLSKIGPGQYAKGRVPAEPDRTLTVDEKQATINQHGYADGCHTCGAKDPGTTTGEYRKDHQPSSGLNFNGFIQYLYPHCATCSDKQGGWVSALKKLWGIK